MLSMKKLDVAALYAAADRSGADVLKDARR